MFDKNVTFRCVSRSPIAHCTSCLRTLRNGLSSEDNGSMLSVLIRMLRTMLLFSCAICISRMRITFIVQEVSDSVLFLRLPYNYLLFFVYNAERRRLRETAVPSKNLPTYVLEPIEASASDENIYEEDGSDTDSQHSTCMDDVSVEYVDVMTIKEEDEPQAEEMFISLEEDVSLHQVIFFLQSHKPKNTVCLYPTKHVI